MARKNIKIEPIKENTLSFTIAGDSDLVLHKKSRQYVLSEVYKQNHPRGTEMPERFKIKNEWEQFITGITWLKPITFHDDDPSLYCEEEWNDYMQNNVPCFLTYAFFKSFFEVFVTFFKESTGKNGTDVKRAFVFNEQLAPIQFASARTDSSIAPGSGINKTPVVSNVNILSGWRTSFSITVPEKVMPVDTVVSMVCTAGKYLGIGSRRAEGYGRYHIEEVKLG